MLPIAGAAGAALLLLGGGLFAATRRRRPEEAREDVAFVEAVPRAAVDPESVRPLTPVMPTPAAMAASPAAAAALPSGFDLSRFGRHTQAAYRGPTPDNPFLSLRRRLKRASFLDARERVASSSPPSAPREAAAAPVAAAPAARPAGLVTTKVRAPSRPGFRPAFQG